jgi:hypothetical protein
MTSAIVTAARRWPIRYRREIVHAARMTAASILAYVLVYALGLSEGLSAVITAIVVTQSSMGGSLKIAFDQFVGSLLGAAYRPPLLLRYRPMIPLRARSPWWSLWGPHRSLLPYSPVFALRRSRRPSCSWAELGWESARWASPPAA